MDKDLYEILGVKKGASQTEIRNAYRKMAKKYHPDMKPGDKASETKFKEANLAYEVLKDSKKRAQYDQMRATGQNPFAGFDTSNMRGGGFGPDAFGDLGLGDLFGEIFGGGSPFGGGMRGGRGAHFRSSPFAQRGSNREATVSISFMEAVKGGERVLELPGNRRITVKIPSGMDRGSKIKLSGQGDPGIGGAPNGDLLLTLDVLPHPYFRREALDVILSLPITFSEAILGAEVQIPTLDGSVHLKIPKGVSSGQRLKLKGKGVHSPQTGQYGDQYVQILIVVPKTPGKSYVDAAEGLKSEGFNPRSELF